MQRRRINTSDGDYSDREINEAEAYMKRTPLTSDNIEEMTEKFELTRTRRREFVNKKGKGTGTIATLNRFPRLKDCFSLVSNLNQFKIIAYKNLIIYCFI